MCVTWRCIALHAHGCLAASAPVRVLVGRVCLSLQRREAMTGAMSAGSQDGSKGDEGREPRWQQTREQAHVSRQDTQRLR